MLRIKYKATRTTKEFIALKEPNKITINESVTTQTVLGDLISLTDDGMLTFVPIGKYKKVSVRLEPLDTIEVVYTGPFIAS